jgi:hypothetical protein
MCLASCSGDELQRHQTWNREEESSCTAPGIKMSRIIVMLEGIAPDQLARSQYYLVVCTPNGAPLYFFPVILALNTSHVLAIVTASFPPVSMTMGAGLVLWCALIGENGRQQGWNWGKFVSPLSVLA